MKYYLLFSICLFLNLNLSATLPAGVPERIKSSNSDSLYMKLNLEEIVVRSFKQGNSFRNIPIAASEITAEDISQKNITSVKELSSVIPNLFMPDYGSKLTSPVYVRGIGSRINSPSVGLYVDGIPYFEKCAFDFEFDQIDKIEVLRGPQGTLYGRNTMGGIINVYTKSPFLYQGIRVMAGAGNYDNYNLNLSVYETINDRLGISVSAGGRYNGGYFTNIYTGQKADSLVSYNYRARISYLINPKSDIHFTSSYENMRQGGYPYAVWDDYADQPGEVNYDAFSSYERKMANNGLSYIYRAKKFHLSSQSSWQYLSDVQSIDQDFSPDNKYFVIQTQNQHSVSEELNMKSSSTGNYKWLIGAFGFYQSSDNLVEMEYIKSGYSTPKYSDNSTYGFALYHQSVFDNIIVKNLSLTLGLRYDREYARTDYTACRKSGDNQSVTDSFNSKLEFSQFTPKASLAYSCKGATTYFTVTKGYKTGGFNTSFTNEDERTFDPEYCVEYELGTKFNLLESRLVASASLFYIDWENQQISQRLSTGTGNLLRNAGKSRSKGFELSVMARPLRNLTLQADYGYTNAEFINYRQSESVDYSGNVIPMVPECTVSGSANYRIESLFGFFDHADLNMSYAGVGKLYWADNNNYSQDYYGLVNAKLSVSKYNHSLELWAKNITNEKYTAYHFESFGTRFAQSGRPFTFGANLILNF